MTYLFRLITWRLACRYYGTDVTRYRGGIDDFILSHISPGDRVLDVGCADGRLTRIIADKAGKAVGLDINKVCAGEIYNGPGCKKIGFMTGDVATSEFKERFDVAVLVHTIEHLKDSGLALRRLSGYARKIVIETPDCESDWIFKLLKDLGVEALGDETHVKLYDGDSLKRELEKNGWTGVTLFKGYNMVRAVAYSKFLK